MYLVFAYDQYYPSGGWNDYRGSFNTKHEAMSYLIGLGPDAWHIIYGNEVIEEGKSV